MPLFFRKNTEEYGRLAPGVRAVAVPVAPGLDLTIALALAP